MKSSLNIKSRLTLWYLLITAVLIAIFSTAAYFLLSQGLYGIPFNPLELRIAQIEKTGNGNLVITGFSNIGQHVRDYNANSAVMVSRYSRNELLDSVSDEGFVIADIYLIDKSVLDTLGLSEDDDVLFYTYVHDNNASLMVVVQSVNNIAAILEAFRQILFIIAPIALVLAGILGYFCVKRTLRPVQSMTEIAGEIEKKSLNKRLCVHSDDELGQLASTLNHMLTRLEDAFDREIQFTTDASHELRTPLAIVQGEATLALKKERSIEEYQQSLETISKESARMSSLLKKLLSLARDEIKKQLEFEEVNLREILTELASDIEVLCQEKSIRCQLQVPFDLFIKGDGVSLRELFHNLLNNAIRYTTPGEEILLTLSQKSHNACVAIKDTGIGIPEEHLKHIFERFYRVDKSRSRSEGGTGLGLAICQRIAELHDGTIKVESKVGEGSTFSVFLPLVSKR